MATAGRTVRDPRLDVFRGFAMFIILLAHTPGNAWTAWLPPGRWGFSDATEIFVFCSGMASAIAFGGTFDRLGWLTGTARVAFRVWQIYWTHICMFLFLATMLAAIDASGWHPETEYIGVLNLWKFFADPAPQIIGLLSLTYVPNYFDILPMYMVVLVMMPAAIALARISLLLAATVSLALWLLAQEALLTWAGVPGWHLSFPAEPWSDRRWYFNPFGWQLLFFTGFAFMRGWLPAPPVRSWLLGLALAVVLMNVVYSTIGLRLFDFDFVREWRQTNVGWFEKTDLGILRYVHFLAMGYLAWSAAGRGGRHLVITGTGVLARIREGAVATISKVGQQSLAVFVFSMVLAQINGYLMDVIGRTAFTTSLVNLTGLGLLVACAYGAGWFKSQPWRVKR